MKFFAVLTAVLAVAAGSYNPVSTWTLTEIEVALNDPNTDPALVPYLIDGLNTIVANLQAGIDQHTVIISMATEEVVTLEQLTAAIHDPNTNPAYLPYYENALHNLMVAMYNGQEEDTTLLTIPAMNVNVWALEELNAALQNPATDPELIIYLEYALNQLLVELFNGGQSQSVIVITPPGVIATVPEVEVTEIIPAPVVVAPEAEVEIPTPVIVVPEAVSPVVPEVAVEEPQPVVEVPKPEPVAPVVASAPLVQLIVNVNVQQQETVAPAPVVNPTPATTPEAVEDGPHIAVNPAGWAPEQETPVIAVNPAGWIPA